MKEKIKEWKIKGENKMNETKLVLNNAKMFNEQDWYKDRTQWNSVLGRSKLLQCYFSYLA